MLAHNALKSDQPLTPGQSIGRHIRQRREECGYTMEYVSQVLKIRKFFLEAIEAGQFDELPGGVYTIGFVKNYISFLDIEDQTIVAHVYSLIGESAPTDGSHPWQENLDKRPLFNKWHVIVALVIVFSALGNHFIRRYIAQTREQPTLPEAALPEKSPVAEEKSSQ